jgi:hypothetical protein
MKIFFLNLIMMVLPLFCFAQTYIYTDTTSGSKIIYEYDNSHAVNINNFKIFYKLTIETPYKSFYFDKLELNNTNYIDKAKLTQLLSSQYIICINKYSRNELSLLYPIIERTLNDYRSRKSEEQIHSLSTQGIYIYSSIFNGAVRDIKDGNVTFTPYGGYLNAICSFVCEEEIIFSKTELSEYVVKKTKTEPNNEGNKYFNSILPNIKQELTSFYEVHNLLNESFQGKWPSGGACGCCGNYSGPCLYWNDVCYIHDMLCQRCQHTWCFSGCKPTSCHNNTLPWYPNP